MSLRTITALYENRAAAESAKQRLDALGVGAGAVDIHDESTATNVGGASAGTAATASTQQAEPGLLGGFKHLFGQHEDAHTYAEGVSRGHVLLTAQVEDARTDDAIRVLDETGALDVDELQNQWKGEGWSAPATGYAATDAADRDEAIPIVEERLVVGKREVERGGVRVRSYVVETPVSEQVSLREENVSIERRPVDRALTGAEDAFQDRTIEMTETAEEAVVAKTATIKEELTIRKDVSQRTEEINDTVRHTEVEVERTPGAHTDSPDRRI